MFGRRPPSPESTVAVEPGVQSTEVGSRVEKLTDETFLEVTEGGYTLVDSGRPVPSLPKFHAGVPGGSAAHTGAVRFASCDVNASARTAELLQIRWIPTLVVCGPDASELGRSLGAVSIGDLDATIRQLDARTPSSDRAAGRWPGFVTCGAIAASAVSQGVHPG